MNNSLILATDDMQDTGMPAQPGQSGKETAGEDRLAALQSLMTLGKYDRNNPGEAPEGLTGAVDCLKGYNAPGLLDILASASPENLPMLARGINQLGFIVPCLPDVSFLGVAVLMAFFMSWTNSGIGRCGMGLLIGMFADGERNIEAFARGLGCGKPRVYRGMEELVSNGLVTCGDHPNKPGAGRPSTQADFARHMTPMVTAAGMPEDELADRQTASERSWAGLESMDGTACGQDEPDAAEPSGKPSEHILQAMQKMDGLVGALDNLIVRAGYGKSSHLHEIRDFFTQQKNRLQDVMDTWSPVIGTDDGNGTDAGAGSNESAEATGPTPQGNVEKDNRENCLFIAGKATQMICQMGDAFEKALGQLGDSPSPYRLRKGLQKGFKLNRFKNGINTQWDGYDILMDDRERILEAGRKLAGADGKPSGNPVGEIDLAALKKSALDSCDALISRCQEETRRRHIFKNKALHEALGMLGDARRFLSGVETSDIGSKDVKASLLYVLRFFSHSFQEWVAKWDEGNDSRAARSVCKDMLSSRNIAGNYIDDYESELRRQHEGGEAEPGQGEEEKEEDRMEDASDETRRKILQDSEALRKGLNQLIANLRAGKQNRRKNKKSKEDRKDEEAIDLAITSLEDVLKQFNLHVEKTVDSACANTWNGLDSVARSLQAAIDKWLAHWKRKDGEYRPTFSAARVVAASIITFKNKAFISRAFRLFDIKSNAAEKKNPGHDIVDSMDVENWYKAGKRLSCTKRNKLIARFWDEGKDPTDIRIWIEYIIGQEYERNYGDPASEYKYCSLTSEQLQNAFAFLTGRVYSKTTLWDILVNKMGYARRQCARLDQIGERHPKRDDQFKYIQSMRDSVDPKKTLLMSIDTKAFVVLGRLKHDNAVLLCSPDGKVYRVYDHDFPFTMNDIYPNGTKHVEKERMNERAVLHPVGVYCPGDNTGYVALVLGKDTAEAVRDLIQKVINFKKAATPGLDSVLILADGGGANMSSGIQWKGELLKLADDNQMKVQVCHFPPGCSRHNPIEHFMWSYISIHWRGKPFLDIEHVVRYVSETTTRSFLKIKCWFEGKKYLTNTEKKEKGDHVLTREELEEKGKGRIIHPFDNKDDMYKWNYIIHPAAPAQAA